MEKKIIIKCKDCGFKYYDGDVHICPAVRVVEVKEETEDPSTSFDYTQDKPLGAGKKETKKTHKKPFKVWKDL